MLENGASRYLKHGLGRKSGTAWLLSAVELGQTKKGGLKAALFETYTGRSRAYGRLEAVSHSKGRIRQTYMMPLTLFRISPKTLACFVVPAGDAQ
jgi:hypothetical protein